MCGIAGFIDARCQTGRDELQALASNMAATMWRRGPDDSGTWINAEAGVALAHRRLAVRDLSETGHQPMTSANNRFVMVYNGEIYDAEVLRHELVRCGHTFRGPSDTEVLLEACVEWGVAAALEKVNGMFAFALWDRDEKTLTLARDRMGIKPLYWAAADGTFLFASELKAMRAYTSWQPQIDKDALASYMRLSYVPTPACIWRNAHKLAPGCILTLRCGEEPHVQRYWDLNDVAGPAHVWTDANEAADHLDALLRTAVRRRLVSDVPLGVFLSGGIDSSAVASIAQAVSGDVVKTFTIGFEEGAYDESGDAATIADHLGSDHYALILTAGESREIIPDLAELFDEPFADSSQIPMLLVSRFARNHVTVALSGDGGDEVFAGYNRHLWAGRVWPVQEKIPRFCRRLGASVLRYGLWRHMGPMGSLRRPGESFKKLASVLDCNGIDEAYRILTGAGVETAGVVLGGSDISTPALSVPESAVAALQLRDMATYLPDDILTKVDRASMAVGLEARVPLLDHEIVNFAQSMPVSMKINQGRGKALLRSVLARYVPRPLFEGKAKTGFAVPMAQWLRGPLKTWAGDLLSAEALNRDGLLHSETIGRWWQEHLSGREDRHQVLWNVLMFQAWLQEQNV